MWPYFSTLTTITDQKLYWSDITQGTVYMLDLGTVSERQAVLQYDPLAASHHTTTATASAHFYGLIQHGEFIYFTVKDLK